MRDGPARRPRHKTKLLLLGDTIDFVNHAINVVRQPRARCTELAVIRQQTFQSAHYTVLLRNRHAPLLQQCHLLIVLIRQLHAITKTDAVRKKTQPATGGDARIKLAQCPCRCVARVGEFFFTFCPLRVIQFDKVALEHQHFAAHFNVLDRFAQLEWNRAHGAQIFGDIFTGAAIAARRTSYEHSITIAQCNGQPVKFRLDRIFHFRHAESLADTRIESAHFILAERIIKRQHRRAMLHFRKRLNGGDTDALGRRVCGKQFGMLCFEGLQFTE